MKKLLTELIGKWVTIHLKSGETIGYQLIVDVFENTLITSYGNTIRLIEIPHIADVAAYVPENHYSTYDVRDTLGLNNKNNKDNSSNDSNSDNNNGKNKDDNKDSKNEKDDCRGKKYGRD